MHRRLLVAGVAVTGLVSGLVSGCGAAPGAPPPSPTSEQAAVEQPNAGPSPSLRADELPAPAELGEDWAVDNSAEDGGHVDQEHTTGWLSARDPEELVWGLAPLGCPAAAGAPSYPRPASALQGRYLTPEGSYAVALSLRFDSEEDARLLLSALTRDAASCDDPPAAGDVQFARQYVVLSAGEDFLHTTYLESGIGATDSKWHSIGLRSGDRLALMLVEERPGESVTLPDPSVLLPDP